MTDIFLGATAAVVTVIFGWLTALRAQYDRVLNVVDFIGSDAVANARHELGTIIEAPARHQALTADQQSIRTKDLFIILWAIGRIEAVRQTLSSRPERLVGGPHKLLRASTEKWVEYWSGHLDESFLKELGLAEGSIKDSAAGLDALRKEWKLNGATGAQSAANRTSEPTGR